MGGVRYVTLCGFVGYRKTPPVVDLHLLTTLNCTGSVALMYFRLHIHKHRPVSITLRALVSETNNIISYDAPIDPKLWSSLLTFVTYLGWRCGLVVTRWPRST